MSEKKYTGLDLLRFLSVIAVVWFHSDAPGADLAYSGLPALLLISLVLPIIRDKGQPFRQLMVKRGERLLIPWMFWSLVYGAYFAQHALRSGEPLSSEFETWMLSTGPMVNLWYLPFAFFATLCGVWIYRFFRSWFPGIAVIILVVVACFLLWAITVLKLRSPPFSQWLFGSISIPLAVAVSIALEKKAGKKQWFFLAAIWSIFSSVVLVLTFWLGPKQCLPYGIGLSLFYLFLTLNPDLGKWGKRFNEVNFGIYTLHPLVFALVASRIFVDSPYRSIIAALCAMVVSWLATLLLLKTPIRRFL